MPDTAVEQLYKDMDSKAGQTGLEDLLTELGERAAGGEPVAALVEEMLPKVKEAAGKKTEFELDLEEENMPEDEERPY